MGYFKTIGIIVGIPPTTELSGVLDFKNYIEISLCISLSESLCDRDYPPDPLDQKLGQATILLPCSWQDGL